MARDFVLPDLGEGLTEAEIRQVLVREGEVVREDAPLLEVETDKATVEIPSPFGGRVEKIHVRPGPDREGRPGAGDLRRGARRPAPAAPGGKQAADTLDPTRTLAPEPKTVVAASGARARPLPRRRRRRPRRPKRLAPVEHAARGRAAMPVPGDALDATAGARAGRRSPRGERQRPGRARDRRRRAGGLRRAGDGGCAGRAGVPARAGAKSAPSEPPVAKPLTRLAAEPPPLPKFEQWGPIERQPLSHLRRTIAERMTLSATVIPHVTHFDRADITISTR